MRTVLLWGSLTDVGNLRQQNEDSILAQAPVFIVADGMGGHAAGEVASAAVVDAFDGLTQLGRLPTPSEVDAVIDTCNDAVLGAASTADHRGMGTTLVGLVLMDNGGSESWLGFHVGDSRLYRFVDSALIQLTTDHSVVQEMLDDGSISAEQAQDHPSRHEITRALGSIPAPRPEYWFGEPIPGERMLLCSDGLTNEVSDGEIVRTLRQDLAAEDAAADLVAQALRSGGRDNISAVVIDVVLDAMELDFETTQPRTDGPTRPRPPRPASVELGPVADRSPS